jgi:beta-lactamase class A
MEKVIRVIILLLCISIVFAEAQSLETLRQDIYQILEGKSATVGVAIWGENPHDTLSINGKLRLPMQSVFKLHLAMAIMYQVDQGKLSLNDTITISKEQVNTYEWLWSPLRENYPEGAEVTLAEIIFNTVAWSDNLGCDLLFELAGGPEVVQSFFHESGIRDIAIVDTEIVMQVDWKRQYDNWTTASAANQVLRMFYENTDSLLSPESHSFLLDVLKSTQTGLQDLRGGLPKDAVVAHKTGYSGQNDEGLIRALNNIGIVFLPDGSYFYISVLVSDSSEGVEGSHEIISEIANAAWDYYQS